MTDSPPDSVSLPPFRPLTSITLGGFQVFDTKTTIPLGRITLFYGPNSAGKSAIEDALQIFSEAIKVPTRGNPTPSFDTAVYERFRRLSPHWRKSSGPYSEWAKSMHIGVTARLTQSLNAALLSHYPRDSASAHASVGPSSAEVAITYRRWHTDRTGFLISRDLLLSTDGIPLAILRERKALGFNLNNPVLRHFQFRANHSAFFGEFRHLLTCQNGWVWLHSSGILLDDDRTILKELVLDEVTTDERISHPQYATFRSALNELCDLFDLLHLQITRSLAIEHYVVPASRRVPTPKDLTFLVHEHMDLDFRNLTYLQELFPAPNYDDPLYRLAVAVAATQRGAIGEVEPPDAYADVNHALSDHLFLDRGYQLTAHFTSIVDDESLRLHHEIGGNIEQFAPVLVRLGLVDSQNRHFTFEEVGSGLGYVLPVLAAVCDKLGSVFLIQQPELHLHPSLQAALADVFLSELSKSDGRQFVVETHSEHFLLRILKRVRQSQTPYGLPEELRVGPDDIVIVYFEASPFGLTNAKRLRVSPDGDFLDRWPNGFFPERDFELFDE